MNNDALKKNTKNYDAGAQSWDEAMHTNVGHLFLEKPAMEKLLPEKLNQKSVLCVGVGSGDEIASLLSRSPQKIVGIDISEELLKITKQKYPEVTTVRSDMHRLPFEDESFDFLYSSLTFHYSSDWDLLLAEVNRVLKTDGILLFSTHNPSRWGNKPATGNTYTNEKGVTVTEHLTELPGGVEITYYNHKNTQAISDSLERAGFKVLESLFPLVVDAEPTDSQRDGYESLKLKNTETPLFFIVKAVKN
jgi:ubiquinone/menaquinone biosynthesis C-methylase UbiE